MGHQVATTIFPCRHPRMRNSSLCHAALTEEEREHDRMSARNDQFAFDRHRHRRPQHMEQSLHQRRQRTPRRLRRPLRHLAQPSVYVQFRRCPWIGAGEHAPYHPGLAVVTMAFFLYYRLVVWAKEHNLLQGILKFSLASPGTTHRQIFSKRPCSSGI